LAQLSNVAPISAEVVGAHRSRRCDAHRRASNATACTDAADATATTAARTVATAKSTAARSTSTLTTLAQTEHRLPTRTAAPTTTLAAARSAASRRNRDATDERRDASR
jgi:hypothetical protein